jgi:hypothetical protein
MEIMHLHESRFIPEGIDLANIRLWLDQGYERPCRRG